MEKGKLYDTSTVIELLVRRKESLIPGAVSALTVIEYPPACAKALAVIYPTKEDFAKAIEWQVKLRRVGKPLPAVDLLIAASALNNDLTLVTLDKHFKILLEVEPNLKVVIGV